MLPYPKNTMNVAAPRRDALAAVRVQLYERDSQKFALPGEAKKRGGRATLSGGNTSGMKSDTTSDPQKMTMSLFSLAPCHHSGSEISPVDEEHERYQQVDCH